MVVYAFIKFIIEQSFLFTNVSDILKISKINNRRKICYLGKIKAVTLDSPIIFRKEMTFCNLMAWSWCLHCLLARFILLKLCRA